MNDHVRHTLTQMLNRPNREKMLELRRFEGMLKDLCPGDRAEAHILLCGLKAKLPDKLQRGEAAGNLDSLLSRLVEELGERFALEPYAAGWAVEAWAVAMGIMPEEEAGVRQWADEPQEVEELPGAKGQTRPAYESWERDSYVTVAATDQHQGDLRSINEALEQIDDGMRILLKPGLYRERLEIKKNVEIYGQGDATEVIIESIRGTTMAVACQELQLTNLTLRAMTTQATTGVYGLQIAEGRVRAKQCRVASSGDTAVIVYGQSSNLMMNECLVGDGPGVGIVFMDLARGTILETEIFGQAAGCVNISQWATPTFQRCRMHGSQVAGVTVEDYGVGTLLDCDIFDHWLSGVTITTGGNPTVDRCRIHGSRAHGVWISEKGEGVIKNNQIYDNGRGPLFVETGCRPKLGTNQATA